MCHAANRSIIMHAWSPLASRFPKTGYWIQFPVWWAVKVLYLCVCSISHWEWLECALSEWWGSLRIHAPYYSRITLRGLTGCYVILAIHCYMWYIFSIKLWKKMMAWVIIIIAIIMCIACKMLSLELERLLNSFMLVLPDIVFPSMSMGHQYANRHNSLAYPR